MESAVTANHDLGPGVEEFRAHVLDGLAKPRKALSPKFFYDLEGSRLFDRITELDEYYPTRAELAILGRHAPDMARRIGPGAALVEYGSGASVKARLLLDALERPSAYVAIDISGEHLEACAGALAHDYPGLPVVTVCADYTSDFDLPDDPHLAGARLVGFFPGSTIGNMRPEEARAFLTGARRVLRGGGFVVGVDLRKDPAVLHAAYNDHEGVTAAFNMNLLARMNRELGADFDLGRFRHRAFWNDDEGRVEMHLESLADQTVTVAGRPFAFRAGETIFTESSYKYSLDGFRALAADAGFRTAETWLDDRKLFSVHFLVGQ